MQLMLGKHISFLHGDASFAAVSGGGRHSSTGIGQLLAERLLSFKLGGMTLPVCEVIRRILVHGVVLFGSLMLMPLLYVHYKG